MKRSRLRWKCYSFTAKHAQRPGFRSNFFMTLKGLERVIHKIDDGFPLSIQTGRHCPFNCQGHGSGEKKRRSFRLYPRGYRAWPPSYPPPLGLVFSPWGRSSGHMFSFMRYPKTKREGNDQLFLIVNNSQHFFNGISSLEYWVQDVKAENVVQYRMDQ